MGVLFPMMRKDSSATESTWCGFHFDCARRKASWACQFAHVVPSVQLRILGLTAKRESSSGLWEVIQHVSQFERSQEL